MNENACNSPNGVHLFADCKCGDDECQVSYCIWCEKPSKRKAVSA